MQIFIFIMYRYSLASIPLNERIMRSKSHSSHVHVPTIIGGRPQSYRNWRKESLTEACKAVAEGELSVRMAAEQYDIPRSTLHDHVSGKVYSNGIKEWAASIFNDARRGRAYHFSQRD